MISRIASFTEALTARANIGSDALSPGDAGTDIQIRRPTASPLDMTAPPMDRRGNQYESYRGIIYAAVDKIAKRVAQIPIHLYQVDHKDISQPPERAEVYAHPFLSLFHPANGRKPHEEYSVWELDYVTSASLDLTGEAWWLVERDNVGRPTRVTPLPSHRMTIMFSKETGITAAYKFTPKGVPEDQGIVIPKLGWDELLSQKMLSAPFITYFRYPGPAGVDDARGWSPVKAAAYSYDINLYEKVYKRNFLKQGAQLGGILQAETNLSKDQIEEYLHQFQTRYSSPRKAGIPMVLPKMLKWTTTEPTPRDIQWCETVKQTDSDILQIYGISDAKLGRADIGNRATADAMDVTFNREVIQSRLDVKTQKLNTDFLPVYPKQTDASYFTCGFDDPVPSDGEMALKREDQDLKNSLYTRNEIRKKRGDKPMGKFGDIVFEQQNNNFFDAGADELVDIRKPGALDEHKAQVASDLAAAKNQPGEDGDVPPKKGKQDGKDTQSGKAKNKGRGADKLTDSIAAGLIAYMSQDDIEDDMYLDIADDVSDAVEKEANIAADIVGGEVDSEAIAGQYLRILRGKVAGINKTTTEAIRTAILLGIANGESISDIAHDIDGLFDIADRSRSLAIGRTEGLGALNFASASVYRMMGVPGKEWVATMDDKTRDSHADANGQIVGVNERFNVGSSQMDFPGDPTAPAEEVINCRCVVAPHFAEEDRALTAQQREALWRSFDSRLASLEHKIRTSVRRVFAKQHMRIMQQLGV